MSNFKGTNQLSTADMFFERLNYKINSFPPGPDSLYVKPVKDFHFAERMLYGRINRSHSVVRMVSAQLKNINSQQKPSDQLQAANFVVDAFEDLVREFSLLGTSGDLDDSRPYLVNLKAYRAFDNADTMYYNYRKIIEGFFLNQYITPETDAAIGTFESFMKFFMDFVNRNSAFYPMTKTAFIPSSFCSPMVSGLSISLSDLDPSDDEGKEEFMRSVNFDYLTQLTKKYGFYIDKYVPWRITADIGSPVMLQYAAKYGARSDTEILDLYYQVAGGSDIEDLQRMAMDFYNTLVIRKPTVRFYKDNKYQSTCRSVVTPEQLQQSYPLRFWLDNYIEIRYNEQQKPGSIGQVDSLKKTVRSVSRQYPLAILISIVNDAFNGFDNFDGSYARKGLKRKYQQTGQNFKPTY
jgi:hypothetical protein